MTPSELRECLRKGQAVFGTLIVSPSPRWPEVVATSGLDFVLIDSLTAGLGGSLRPMSIPAGVELYNLRTDLSETTDLAEKQPDLRDALLLELEAWRVSVRAEQMLPNPNFDPNARSEKQESREANR